MRIALVTTHYWPSLGGVERVAMSLANAYRAEGHEVVVVAKQIDERLGGPVSDILRPPRRFESFSMDGVRVRQLRLSLPQRAALLPLATELVPLVGRLPLRWLRSRGAGLYAAVVGPAVSPLLAGTDVVHVLGGDLLAVSAVEAAHALNIAAAVTPFAHPGPPGFDPRAVRAWQAADAVLATTEADAKGYRASGVASERLQVCGVPVPALGLADAAIRPEPPGDAPVVLFVGARRPDKGWKVLLESTAEVWERFPEALFAFVGPGQALPSGDERVIDVGRCSDAERAAWVRRATMLCLPSAWESFGLVVAEGWSESVPSIVTDTPVLRDLVDSSGGGVVASGNPSALAQEVVRLLDRPELAQEMGQAGRRYWQRECDPTRVARRHLDLYRRLGDSRSRGRS